MIDREVQYGGDATDKSEPERERLGRCSTTRPRDSDITYKLPLSESIQTNYCVYILIHRVRLKRTRDCGTHL